jgi:hypothetical protein
MYPARYKIALRITHPNMDPEDISTKLGLNPFRKWKAGTQRTTPAGKKLSGIYKETYCVFDLGDKTGRDLVETLSSLTKKLVAFKPLLQNIRSTGGSIEYSIGLFVKSNTGVVIDQRIMIQLVDLGIDLLFDIYESEDTPGKATRRAAK